MMLNIKVTYNFTTINISKLKFKIILASQIKVNLSRESSKPITIHLLVPIISRGNQYLLYNNPMIIREYAYPQD
jgi:hypothetical protein